MKKDLVYLLIDGEDVQAFGNLKTLLAAIHAVPQYSKVWRLLDKGKGECSFGVYTIKRTQVNRAPYAKAV